MPVLKRSERMKEKTQRIINMLSRHIPTILPKNKIKIKSKALDLLKH